MKRSAVTVMCTDVMHTDVMCMDVVHTDVVHMDVMHTNVMRMDNHIWEELELPDVISIACNISKAIWAAIKFNMHVLTEWSGDRLGTELCCSVSD